MMKPLTESLPRFSCFFHRAAAPLCAVGLMAFFLSCQTPGPGEVVLDDPGYVEWKERAEQTRHLPLPVPAPEVFSPETLPGFDPHEPLEPTPPLPDIPVRNLVMTREVDVAVLLRAMADAADVNIIIGENVAGPMRINLREETTWDSLFLSLVKAHGLHYEWDRNLLRVMARPDIERQIAMEKVLSERQQAEEERKSAEPLMLDLYRVRYADAEKLAGSIKAALAAVPAAGSVPTTIHPDLDSGLLIIHASPANLERARNLAQALDQPARQILIEATIVQANSETARELGFQWGFLHSGTASGSDLTIGTAANPAGFNAFFPAGFDPEETGFTFGLERISEHQMLQAQLSALQRDGRLNIISSPSITTLDKQTAVIESGEERPFQTSTGTGLAAVSTVEFKKALLRLEVTPQVIDGNWIKLRIETTKDEFDDSKAVIIDGTLQVPIITRAATTMLYLADGETTVIGGLSTESQRDGSAGIPLLKDLPGLGALFRSTNNRTALSDTLIFITPYILPENRVPAESAP